jgi:hypothetical protein
VRESCKQPDVILVQLVWRVGRDRGDDAAEPPAVEGDRCDRK